MTKLTELFATDDMSKQKYELAINKYYKLINALLRHNPSLWKFNTRDLNKEIPLDEKHFIKRKLTINTVLFLCKKCASLFLLKWARKRIQTLAQKSCIPQMKYYLRNRSQS